MTEIDALEADALARDATDTEGLVRARFVIPKDDSGSGYPELAYLAGNSLGPEPVETERDVRRELEDWATLAAGGHVAARRKWGEYHVALRAPMARVVGATDDEVVVMNSLTVNLHLLLASFYRPTAERHGVVVEDDVFPSDSYAISSHVRFRGYDPAEAVTRLRPREGERLLRTEDVLEHLERAADRTALVLLGGVNYKTGQLFEIERITAVARRLGITVGWDLAHAAGNVELALHEWGPDFAAWCTYKYLNAGPGSTGAAFVHARHLPDRSLDRLAGWWSTDPAVRFEMRPELTPIDTADAWAISSPPILSMAPLHASLAIFDEVTMPVIAARSRRLTAYLARLLVEGTPTGASIVSPGEPSARGSMLSIAVPQDPSVVAARLRSEHGVAGDARNPDIVRLAPAPLFSTYHDCWRAARALREVLS